MPRENNHGEVAGDKRRPIDFKAIPLPQPAQAGYWDWAQVEHGLVVELIAIATAAGDAVSFATNRANTAGSITILHGGERPRYYANSYNDAEQIISGIVLAYGGQ